MKSKSRLIVVAVALATVAVPMLAPSSGVAVGVTFEPSVRLTPDGGQGYEPSIKVDSAGTVFVTAHKKDLVMEGTMLRSWMWRSTDAQTFQPMQGGELFWAFEGDWAIDGNDRLYFVDTYAGDMHAASWSEHGTTMDYYRPFTLTSAIVDDRPWLTAHHDGYVYLLVNLGYTPNGRLELYRSTDGGRSFEPTGRLFPESGWGTPAADPGSDHVYVAMNDKFYGNEGKLLDADSDELFVWVSPDRGASFTRSKVADYAQSDPDGYPVVAVDAAGNVFVLWSDGTAASSRLRLSRSTDRGATWTTFDVTPEGMKWNDLAWLAADPTVPGLLGIGWYGSKTARAVVDYQAGIITDAHTAGAPVLDWTTVDAEVQKEPSWRGVAPQDFAQVAFGPDHRLHVTWGTWRKRAPEAAAITWDIWYAVQATGPNLPAA